MIGVRQGENTQPSAFWQIRYWSAWNVEAVDSQKQAARRSATSCYP